MGDNNKKNWCEFVLSYHSGYTETNIHVLSPRTHHGQVGVHGVEFHVDLFVDALLRLGVVVLPHLTGGHFLLLVLVAGCWQEGWIDEKVVKVFDVVDRGSVQLSCPCRHCHSKTTELSEAAASLYIREPCRVLIGRITWERWVCIHHMTDITAHARLLIQQCTTVCLIGLRDLYYAMLL